VVSKDGVETDPEKIKAVAEWRLLSRGGIKRQVSAKTQKIKYVLLKLSFINI